MVAVVRKAEKQFLDRKLDLADAFLRLDNAKKHVEEAEASMINVIEAVSLSVGIDPTDNQNGLWAFDVNTMSFVRVGP